MNFQTQAALFLAVFGIVISAVALDRNRKSAGLFPFLSLAISLVVWSIGYAVYKISGTGYQAAYAGSLLLVPSAIWMTRILLGGRGPIGRTLVVVTFGAVAVLLVAMFIPGVMPEGGELHRSFQTDVIWQLMISAYFFIPFLGCLFVLFVHKSAVPSQVAQRRLSLIFYVAFATTMIALLEYANRWGMGFAPITRVAAILFLYVLHQSGLEYRSFGVAEIVSKVVVFIVSSLLLAVIYGVLVYWVGNDPILFVFNTLAASFVILILYEPVISRLEERAGELFFKERGTVRRAVAEATNKMTRLVRLEDLHAFIHSELPQLLSVERSILLLTDKQNAGLHPVTDNDETDQEIDLTAADVQTVFAGREESITLADLDAWSQQVKPEQRKVLQKVRMAMQHLGLEALAPLNYRDSLLGVWGFTPVSIHKGMTAEDIELLASLAPQIALQIENSSIYTRLLEQERLAALGEMAAGLAHEIKNPLGTLKGAAQIIDRQNLSQKDEKFLEIIVEETDRLNTALSRFLQYARPYSPVIDRFDLGLLVDKTLKQFVLGASSDSVTVKHEASDEIGQVECDGQQIQQVLVNLFHNAMHAMENGGTLMVKSFLTGADEGNKQTTLACIQVEDEGQGIDSKSLDRIFEPFFTTKRAGSGLGLAISKRIIEAHGGSITVKNRKTKGVSVTIRLPITSEV